MLPRTAENQQLVLEEEILSDHNPRAAPRPEAHGDSGKRWMKRTNTVFIVAKTRGMAAPLAKSSRGVISVHNWQFESHTSSLDLGGVTGILKRCGLPPERRD